MRHALIIFTLFFLITAPVSAQAASTCYCYFGEKNDCEPVAVSANAQQAECTLACQSQFQDLSVGADFTDDAGSAADVAASSNCSQAHSSAIEIESKPFQGGVIPKLQVDIPGVTFSPILQKGGKLTVSFLGEYITGVYKYLIVIASVIAVVFIMVGGLQYVLAAGGGDIDKAKTRMKNAVIGLVLLLSVVLILETVNPQLATFSAITLQGIERVEEEAQQHAEDAAEESQEPVSETPTTPAPTTQTPTPTPTAQSPALSGEKVALPYSDGGRLKMEYIQLPLEVGDQYISPPRSCTIPVPSEPAQLSSVEINYQYLGKLDCNISKRTKNKKRPDSDVKMVILHQGFKSDGGQNGAMWFQDYHYGKIVTCQTNKKTGIFNYQACKRNGQRLVKQPTLNQTPIGSHFAVTLGGTIYQLADVGHVMNHCCAENKISVGIDLQYSTDGKKNVYSDAQYEAVAKLIKGLSQKYGFIINDSTVKGHCELGKHSDPPNYDLKKLGQKMGITLDPGQHGSSQCSWIN